MVYRPRLREGQELAGMACAGTRYGEVAVVHLVNNKVGGRLAHRSPVGVPACGVGGGHVDDGSALSVDAHGFGKDAGRLAAPHVEGVEASHQVALHLGAPAAVLVVHLDGLQRLASRPGLVDTHLDGLGLGRSEEGEGGLFG